MGIRIAVCAALLCLAGTVPACAQMVSAETEDIKWVVNPALPNAKLAVIHGTPASPGRSSIASGCPPTVRFPPIVIRPRRTSPCCGGRSTPAWATRSIVTSKPYRAGGYFSMPADHPHYVLTKEETLIQVHGVGPTSITFVDPADDPRKK